MGYFNPFRYRGYYWDRELGLYYLQSRYYDPELCRFISSDDVNYLDPASITGLNLYSYCDNNPVMYVDPTGTFPFIVALIIGIVAGAVIGGTVNGVNAYNEGRRGWELFASIAGGALVGGAMGATLVLGGAAGLAATGATVAGFSMSTVAALGTSLAIGATASMKSYLLINGIHHDKQITFGGVLLSGLSGLFQAGATFGIGYLGGKNGLFNKLGNFTTIDEFYKIMIKTTGKINPLASLFYATSALFGDTITKAVYLSSFAAGARAVIKWLINKIPN